MALEEPSARSGCVSATIDSNVFIWGGELDAPGDTSHLKYLYIFQSFKEKWNSTLINGQHPSGYKACGSAQSGNVVYVYGGLDGDGDHTGSLFCLDLEHPSWRELISPDQNGPKKKRGCGMAVHEESIIVFGGADYSSATNELHVYKLSTGSWESPITSGDVPQPSSYFSFDRVTESITVLFGGASSNGTVLDDLYILDVNNMHWTKIAHKPEELWPEKRKEHGSTCLAKHTDNAQLLISGGTTESGNIYTDLWLLNIARMTWSEIVQNYSETSSSTCNEATRKTETLPPPSHRQPHTSAAKGVCSPAVMASQKSSEVVYQEKGMDFTVMVVGKPRSGKSTALNNIFGISLAASVATSITQTKAQINGISFRIIDTSGLGAIDIHYERVLEGIDALNLQGNGLLLLCVPVAPGRLISTVDESLIRIISSCFGKEVWDYCCVLLTFCDFVIYEFYTDSNGSEEENGIARHKLRQYEEYLRSYCEYLTRIFQNLNIKKEVRLVLDYQSQTDFETVTPTEIVALPTAKSATLDLLPTLEWAKSIRWTDLAFLEIIKKSGKMHFSRKDSIFSPLSSAWKWMAGKFRESTAKSHR